MRDVGPDSRAKHEGIRPVMFDTAVITPGLARKTLTRAPYTRIGLTN